MPISELPITHNRITTPSTTSNDTITRREGKFSPSPLMTRPLSRSSLNSVIASSRSCAPPLARSPAMRKSSQRRPPPTHREARSSNEMPRPAQRKRPHTPPEPPPLASDVSCFTPPDHRQDEQFFLFSLISARNGLEKV